MPIDYSKYPKNWKSEIRPFILNRANNKCEFCNVDNYKLILRGEYNGVEAYQDNNGTIYNANNSERIGSDYLGEVDTTLKNKLIEVVLTIAHLDHNITNNDYSNLKALCQRCHNRYDSEYRKNNRKVNRQKHQPNLF